jgi:hypothetical protein
MSKLVKRVCVNGVWFMPGDTPPVGLWPRLSNPAVWEGGIVPVAELKAAEPEVKAVPKKVAAKKPAAKKAAPRKAAAKKVAPEAER